jgi:hypothetical protein
MINVISRYAKQHHYKINLLKIKIYELWSSGYWRQPPSLETSPKIGNG